MSRTYQGKALQLTVVLLLLWLAAFNQTLLDMTGIWLRSDTFAHGFLVYPICLWLIWRRRFMLAEIKLKAAPLFLIPWLGCTALWLAASAAGIQVLMQLAAVAWLPFALWTMFGHGLIRILWFPLCYMIFAVPMGEEFIPQLQLITADMTVWLLTLSQIPVFRDGLYISIPGGLFEVAVACSGIRYLIASIALGTLYAHLQFYSLKRQIGFIAIASIIPILANGVRAYIIVLLAYLSEMSLATGVDHLIYGWLFFGLVMFLLFWIGSYWRQAKAEPPLSMKQPGQWHKASFSLITMALGISMLAASLAYNHYLNNKSAEALVINPSKANAFMPTTLSNWQPSFHLADEYHTGRGQFAGQSVELYIAFYRDNQQNKELINSTHQLFNHEAWTPELRQTKNLNKGQLRQIPLISPAREKRTLWYWYQLENLKTANKNKVKLQQAWAKLTAQSTAGAVVILSTVQSENTTQALQAAHDSLTNSAEAWFIE